MYIESPKNAYASICVFLLRRIHIVYECAISQNLDDLLYSLVVNKELGDRNEAWLNSCERNSSRVSS